MRANSRSGFTLLELAIAIVLMAAVSALVYGAAETAGATQARLASEQHGLQRALGMRVLLVNALAGAQIDFFAPDSMFVVEHRGGGGRPPRDRLRFVAAGGLAPLSPGADWSVTLEPTPGGLRLSGSPLAVQTPARTLAVLPGITGLAVRTFRNAPDPGWSPDWTVSYRLPDAVEITYWTDTGPVGVPIRVALPLGGAR